MKKILLLLLALFVFASAFATPNWQQLTKNTPGLEQYPNSAAITIYEEINFDVKADLSFEKKVSYMKKILNYKGKKAYSDVRFVYDKNYEELVLGECFTITKDGKKVELPEEAVYDSETEETSFFPEFNNTYETIVNLPAVQKGSFIIVNYTLKSKRPDVFSGTEHFKQKYPILYKKLTINTPKNLKLYSDFPKNSDIKFTSQSGKYEWEIKNIGKIVEESMQPSNLVLGLPVVYSNFANWESYAKSIIAEFEKGIIVNKQIIDLAKEIGTDFNNDEAKLKAIYKFIAKNYSVRSSNFKNQNPTPQKLNQTIADKFGSQRDLTALFIALAKAAGVSNIEPVIALNLNYAWSDFKDFALRNALEDIYVISNDTIIKPGHNEQKYGCFTTSEKSVVTKNGRKVFDKLGTYRHIKTKIIADTKAKVISNWTFKGSSDYLTRARFVNSTPKRIKKQFTNLFLSNAATLVSGPNFTNLKELDQELSVNFESEIDNFIIDQGKYLYFTLPEAALGLHLPAADRETGVVIRNDINSVEEVIITNLPKDIKLIKPYGENFYSIKTANGTVVYHTNVEQLENGDIKLERKMVVPAGVVKLETYKNMRKILSKATLSIQNMVFFEKKDID